MPRPASLGASHHSADTDTWTTRTENTTRLAPGLPLPSLELRSGNRRQVPYIALSTVSPRGRLAIAGPIRHLEWTPGQSLSISLDDGCIEMRTANREEADLRIGPRLHVYLPASLRHAADVRSGDKVLVAALTPPRLRIYPSAKLEAMLSRSAEHDRAQR